MGSEVTTYERVQAMTPTQREAHFDACIVWDLDRLTPAQRRIVDEQARRILAREEPPDDPTS